MCTNNSLESFPNQAASYEIILIVMYLVSAVLITTNFCVLLIYDIEAESKENQLRSALVFFQTPCPVSI